LGDRPRRRLGRAGGRKVATNLQVVNYQKALREELTERLEYGGTVPMLGLALDLTIYYFRSTERGHPADVTNLNKSTEDALQGILFDNDRNNHKVTGEIIEQHPDVEHVGLIIVLENYEFDPDKHEALLDEMVQRKATAFENTDYQPPQEDYL